MSSLAISNDKIGEIITKYDSKLDITEFLTEIGYDIDKIYIDRFWDSIQEDRWLYIDDNMLYWIGYSDNDIINGKKNYIRLLENILKLILIIK